jgi:hypothetical protein
MFTENEIAFFINDSEIKNATNLLKKDFIKTEALYLEISEHDFLSLVLLTPQLAIALANGKISFWEEIKLNKKARRFSKGGYFFSKDPVSHSMKYLIKSFPKWEEKFYDLIKLIVNKQLNPQLLNVNESGLWLEDEDFKQSILKTPYIFIRLLSSLFLEREDEIMMHRRLLKTEHQKLVEIGQKIGFDRFPLFIKFCNSYETR